MSDQNRLASRSAFDDLLPRICARSGARVTIDERTGLAISTVLAGHGSHAALASKMRSQYGVTLPDGPERVTSGDITLLGIGRERWLALRPGKGQEWCTELNCSLDGLASAVDQSDGLGVVEIGGPHAREILAKGLPIDLHPKVFGPGSVAVTMIAHIGVTIWRCDPEPVFAVAVARSLAGSFSHWLSASAAKFGAG